jgi:acetyl esterase/lipase
MIREPHLCSAFQATFPRILIQVGSEEVLLDDSLRYAVEARKAGAPITLELWQGDAL